MALPAASISRLRDSLTCPLCLDLFDDHLKRPKALPCIHTMCLSCLEGYVKNQKAKEGYHLCPICRGKFIVPAGGVHCLPNNTSLMGMIDLVPLELSTNPMGIDEKLPEVDIARCSIHCDDCFMYCTTCDIPLCVTCIATDKSHISHDICGIHDTTKKEFESIAANYEKIRCDFGRLVDDSMAAIYAQEKKSVKSNLINGTNEVMIQWQEKVEQEFERKYSKLQKKIDDFTNSFFLKEAEVECFIQQFRTLPTNVTKGNREELKKFKALVESLAHMQTFGFEELKDSASAMEMLQGEYLLESKNLSLAVRVKKNSASKETDMPQVPTESKEEECIMVSDIGNVCDNTVRMLLIINDFKQFLKRDLHSALYSQYWYLKGTAWTVMAQCHLPRADDSRYPDKDMPLMWIGVRCEDMEYGCHFRTNVNFKLFDFDNSKFVVNFEGHGLEFHPKLKRKGFFLASKADIYKPGYRYVRDNTMRILVSLTMV